MLVFGPSTKRRCLVNPRKAFLGSLRSPYGPGGSGGDSFSALCTGLSSYSCFQVEVSEGSA